MSLAVSNVLSLGRVSRSIPSSSVLSAEFSVCLGILFPPENKMLAMKYSTFSVRSGRMFVYFYTGEVLLEAPFVPKISEC